MTLQELIEQIAVADTHPDSPHYGEGHRLYRGRSENYSSLRRLLPAGFTEVAEWNFSWYARTWISDSLMCTVSWAEGDICISTHTTIESYWAELSASAKFYRSMWWKTFNGMTRPVIRRSAWDRLTDDQKGIKDGTPYLLYLEPVFGWTTYGPCIIEEEEPTHV